MELEHYRLYRNDQLLGALTRTGSDMRWELGTFTPTPAFEELRPQFAHELALLNGDRMDDWESLWGEIAALGLRLEAVLTRETINEFLLHIDGSNAWWQY